MSNQFEWGFACVFRCIDMRIMKKLGAANYFDR